MSDSERTELIGWLQDALAARSNIDDAELFDPHQALDAADRLCRWHGKADAAKGIAAIKTSGAAFEAIAEKATALTAIAWLENLSMRYRVVKLMDDAARVEAAIRARGNVAQQSMKRLEVRFEVPSTEMEAWLEELTAGSLDLSLQRIAVNLMTSEEHLRDLVKTQAANSVLMARVPISIMGPGGFTTAHIGGRFI